MTEPRENSETQATIYITKLAAAQRQLTAAIRLFFAGEDELAVQTIAHASYRLLSDLKASRGHDEAADSYLTSVFYAVRSFRRGTLPDYIASNAEMMKWITDMASRLPITASSKAEDVAVSVSSDMGWQFWNERNRISNFLKHADRDSATHISLGDVDNRLLIMQSLSAYLDVTGNQADITSTNPR